MGFFSVILLPVAFAIAAYLYFALKRFCATISRPVNTRRGKLLLAGIALAIAVCGTVFSLTGAVFLLYTVAIAGVLQLFNFLLKRIARQKYENGFRVWKRVYGLFLIPILLSALAVLCGYLNLHTARETAYTVHTSKEIRAEGYRVALVADVHFGISFDEQELLQICRQIEAQSPDLVILCGDVVDNSATREGMQAVFGALGGIQSTYGVYYVYGNHDRPSRMMQGPFTTEELNRAITESGIRILQDESVQITEDLLLVGREDRSAERNGGRMSLEELLASADPTDFILTLDHQPNEYAQNAAAGTDLLLSGHTHGGQLFPLDILQMLIPFNDGVYGQYTIGEGQYAIITSGLGTWEIPVKNVAPAEYVIIDIFPK